MIPTSSNTQQDAILRQALCGGPALQGLPRWAFVRCTASPPFQEAGTKRNKGALRAATLEAPQTSVERPSRTAESLTGAQERHEQYNWAAQWYPIASEMDLDPSKPQQMMLLGKPLVLWRDTQQQWRCFEDICPHRKVPLSEGRIENGGLQCGYHGWVFGPEGRPTYIPQLHSVDTKAEETACASNRACAASFPTQVQQGLIWVWAESGPAAFVHSTQRQPVINPLKANTDPGSFTQTYINYVRDLPGGFQEWIENMTDQSHVAFAHHTVAGNRHGPEAGYFKAVSMDEKDVPEEGFSFVFDWSANSKTLSKGTTLEYIPPVYNGFTVAGGVFSLWIYAVPVSATCTRLIINAGGNFPKPPLNWKSPAAVLARLNPLPQLLRRLRQALRPAVSLCKPVNICMADAAARWAPHLQLNAVNDGDIIFMHQQTRNNRAAGPSPNFGAHYFTPGDSDRQAECMTHETYFTLYGHMRRGVVAWRRWLTQKAGGGPEYAEGGAVGDPFRDSLGKLRRRELLDRYSQHTQHCVACNQALQRVRWAQKGAWAAAGAAFLVLVACLGQGAVPLSAGPLVSAAALAAGALAASKLSQLEAQFVHTGWENHNK